MTTKETKATRKIKSIILEKYKRLIKWSATHDSALRVEVNKTLQFVNNLFPCEVYNHRFWVLLAN